MRCPLTIPSRFPGTICSSPGELQARDKKICDNDADKRESRSYGSFYGVPHPIIYWKRFLFLTFKIRFREVRVIRFVFTADKSVWGLSFYFLWICVYLHWIQEKSIMEVGSVVEFLTIGIILHFTQPVFNETILYPVR